MRNMRQRARTPGWLGLLALLFLGASAAQPAGAQPYPTWVKPGRHPFTGTPEQACSLLAAATPLTKAQCLDGITCIEAGKGSPHTLQDKDVVTTVMTDSTGKHSAPTMVVAFTDDADRAATACSVGRTDGLQLLKVHACSNWTVGKVPPEPEEPMKRAVVPPERNESQPDYYNSIMIPNCCDCGPGYLYVPGGVIENGGGTRSGPVEFRQYPSN